MSTVLQLATHIKDRLDGSNRATRDRLAKTLGLGQPTLTLKYSASQVHSGDYLGIGTEVVYVWDDEKAPEHEISRAQLSTKDNQHDAGAVVEIRPSHPLGVVIQDIRHEILQLVPSVYKVVSGEVTLPGSHRTFDLPNAANPLFPLRFTEIPVDNTGAEEKVSVMIEGTKAHVTGSARTRERKLRCYWAEEFDVSNWAESLDLLSEEVGLTETLQDAVHFGVMARRLIEAEALRADLDVLPTSRNAEDFPPGYGIQAANSYMAVRDRLVAQEQGRLYERWQPVMI